MTVTLLAGAGLTILSFWNSTQVDLGIRTDHTLTFGLPVNEGRFSSPDQIDDFYRSLLERFQAVPGVVHASVSAPALPLLSTGFPRQFSVVGQTDDAPSLRPRAGVHMVTPDYFETFGMRLVRGRPLTADDGPSAQRVAVVDERFVKRFLEDRDPLGQHVVMDQFVPGSTGLGFGAVVSGSPVEWRIVGVLHNVSNFEQFGDPGAPQIYVPFAQSPWPQAMVAVRAATSPGALRPSLAAAVQAVAPDLPLMDVQTMDQIVGARLAPDRLNVALYGGLAALALTLAALAPLVRAHELKQGGTVMRDENVTVRRALVDHPPVKPAFAYRFDSVDRSIRISRRLTTRTSQTRCGLTAPAARTRAVSLSARTCWRSDKFSKKGMPDHRTRSAVGNEMQSRMAKRE